MIRDPQIGGIVEKYNVVYELVKSLIELRLKRGVSQTELARRVGTKQPVISRLERMASTPTISFLAKIASALNVRLRVYFQA